jgi:hypothetical protein
MYVMERYQLQSDPCDYRLIRINNCIQILACVCNILAIFIDDLRLLAQIINHAADLMYQCISGCMTAQVRHAIMIMMILVNHVLYALGILCLLREHIYTLLCVRNNFVIIDLRNSLIHLLVYFVLFEGGV